MKLLVGLGNPEEKYSRTRHNLGFWVVDLFVAEKEEQFHEEKALHSALAKIPGLDLLVIKPMTYVNLSGDAVQKVTQYYKIQPEEVLVVRDDIDMEVGKIRIKNESGSGGNNGIKNIIERVGDRFTQLKVGVGRPEGSQDVADYVLEKPTSEQSSLLNEAVKEAALEIQKWLD
ncbi:aminoacyl-tRNA hydrolase [soil metagenome]